MIEYGPSPIEQRNILRWTTAIPLAASVIAVADCGSAEEGLPPGTVDYSQPVIITYEATGSAESIDAVLEAGDERVELTNRLVQLGTYGQHSTMDDLREPPPFEGPITLEVSVLERVSIQVTVGPGGGTIECRLLADGEVLDTAVAAAPYATARCEDKAPAPRS